VIGSDKSCNVNSLNLAGARIPYELGLYTTWATQPLSRSASWILGREGPRAAGNAQGNREVWSRPISGVISWVAAALCAAAGSVVVAGQVEISAGDSVRGAFAHSVPQQEREKPRETPVASLFGRVQAELG